MIFFESVYYSLHIIQFIVINLRQKKKEKQKNPYVAKCSRFTGKIISRVSVCEKEFRYTRLVKSILFPRKPVMLTYVTY